MKKGWPIPLHTIQLREGRQILQCHHTTTSEQIFSCVVQSPNVSVAAGFTQHRASRESLFSPRRHQTAGCWNKQSTPALPVPCCHSGSHRPVQSHVSTQTGDRVTIWLLMKGARQDPRAKWEPTGTDLSLPWSSPLINHVLSYTNRYYVNLYRYNIRPIRYYSVILQENIQNVKYETHCSTTEKQWQQC